MNWFKVQFDDVFFNGLTTAEVGCVIKYKCMCQQLGVKELSLSKLRSIFTSREIKFVQSYFKLCSKNTEVCSKNAEVCSKNAEVCSEKVNENKDLTRAHVYNNTKNKDNNKKERKERKERENIGGEPPEKNYSFEGEVIKLNQKDFDRWKLAYPDLNLYVELLVRDRYLAGLEADDKTRKNWFMSTAQYFVTRNAVRKSQNDNLANDDRKEESLEEYFERSVL